MSDPKPRRPDVLDLPVQVGVRRLVLSFMRDAEEARRRRSAADDSEALHDLRVALRRLRSTERAYRPFLEDSIRPRLRKRLRVIARATRESRDLEVHINLLADRFAGNDVCMAGVEHMLEVLHARKKAADSAMDEAIRLDFDKVTQRLHEKLRRFTATVPPVGAPIFRTTGDVCGELLTHALAELEARVTSLRSVEQQDVAHRARIAAKRLRYLAEPFSPQLPEARVVVESLKDLQDGLGDLHDLHVLLETVTCELSSPEVQPDRDRTTSLEALQRRLHQERDTQFTHVRDKWLDGNSEELFGKTRALAAELRSHIAR
jgi:CHAD domain-containing protein